MAYNPRLGKRVDAEKLSPETHADLVIWFIFNIGGDQVLLTLLVATFLCSREVTRHPTMINICCAWMLTGIIASLLLYAHQQTGPEPDKALCIAQAVMISPVPAMTSMAGLMLIYYTWSAFRFKHSLKPASLNNRRTTTTALLCAPYATYICFLAGALHVALQAPSTVNRSHRFFYCSIDFEAFNIPMAFFTTAVCSIAIGLEVHLAIMLSRDWKAKRHAGLVTGVNLQLTVRIGIFMAYVFCGSIIELVSCIVKTRSIIPDMFAASAGIALFIVFATQPDVLRAWSRLLRRFIPRQSRMASALAQPVRRSPTPQPSFDLDLLQRSDREYDEKARLAALHAYFNARVHLMGIEVEVIKRPEDAFVVGRDPRRVRAVLGRDSRKAAYTEAWWTRSFDPRIE
ncbi:hypothetical protein NUW54_g9593 [Trametes sanguinea]|uniref:Uncharacterized protein n=1 Tax=Trametes sanguinea TaxID=158606 RepID=A0ACC1P7Q9_9APHY|nr:hypothetical protein NUW54_g9593 [Trametes sanguinea]